MSKSTILRGRAGIDLLRNREEMREATGMWISSPEWGTHCEFQIYDGKMRRINRIDDNDGEPFECFPNIFPRNGSYSYGYEFWDEERADSNGTLGKAGGFVYGTIIELSDAPRKVSEAQEGTAMSATWWFGLCRSAGWMYCHVHDRPLYMGSDPCIRRHPLVKQHYYWCPSHDGRDCACSPYMVRDTTAARAALDVEGGTEVSGLHVVYAPQNGEVGLDWVVLIGDPIQGRPIAWCPTEAIAQWIADHSSTDGAALTVDLSDASNLLAGLQVMAAAKWGAPPSTPRR